MLRLASLNWRRNVNFVVKNIKKYEEISIFNKMSIIPKVINIFDTI